MPEKDHLKRRVAICRSADDDSTESWWMSQLNAAMHVQNSGRTLQICSCGVLYENAKICLSIENLLGFGLKAESRRRAL